MIEGLFFIFLFLVIGEAISKAAGLPVPGNVIGMVLLTFALTRGWVSLERVRGVAEVLVKNMAFLFVPPGVGLMVYFDLLRKEWLAIAVSWFLSTLVVLAVVGFLQKRLEERKERDG
ncbi:CidA/LrgA family protein [Thermodesulforhabdus norvegica]|uniref:Holin-like protein n=1 Tax=Thermodesulforhabdus norvegica TaxID=39841 RepID=A0A1I4W6C1_9BACT|nr:CidA/LrgA family protein [Thermodesulforhabdus norvegica]SFN09121.1 holin-like protein [Thermodesulforhabdus norvegica]